MRVIYVHGAFADADSWFGVPDAVETIQGDLFPKRVQLKHHRGNRPVPLDIGSLDDYVKSIEGKLPDDETEKCVLVGHSLGGMAISAAATAPAFKDRIHKLIYVTAVLPMPGQTAGELLPVLSGGPADVLLEFAKLGTLGAIKAATALASQPMGVFNDLMPESDHFLNAPKAYIRCLDDGIIPHSDQREMISKINDATNSIVYDEALDTVHFPQVSMPGRLAEMIVEAIEA